MVVHVRRARVEDRLGVVRRAEPDALHTVPGVGPDAYLDRPAEGRGLDFKVSAHPAAPAWGREAVVYQVFPDRFARSAAADERPVPDWAVPAAWDDEVVFEGTDPRTPLQYFGGDLDGVTEHLAHVQATGATVLYTTPVFPGESNRRSNTRSRTN